MARKRAACLRKEHRYAVASYGVGLEIQGVNLSWKGSYLLTKADVAAGAGGAKRSRAKPLIGVALRMNSHGLTVSLRSIPMGR